jgi:hypothetical protein
MDQSVLTENVDSLFKSLENFTQNEGIIGKPVTQETRRFCPSFPSQSATAAETREWDSKGT